MRNTTEQLIRHPLMEQVCWAIRAGRHDEAMTLLTESEMYQGHDGYALNLLGVVHECRREWDKARRAYGKAMVADKALNAPRQNLRRLYELNTFGRTNEPLSLGDHEILLRKRLDKTLTQEAMVSTPF